MFAFSINFIVSIVALPIYLYHLGYEKYGVWLVLATILTFTQMADLGIGSAITKYVAEYYEQGNIKAIERHVTTALYGLSASGFVVFLAIMHFRPQIISAFRLDTENSVLALQLLPYVGILTLYAFIVEAISAVVSGLGRMDLTAYFRLVGRITGLTVSAGLLFSGYGIPSLLVGRFISELTIHISCFVWIRRFTSMTFWRIHNTSKSSLKQLVTFGSGVMGGRTLNMLLKPFNTLVIARYIGVESIPIYDIAFNVAMNIRGLASAGLAALMPEVSRLSVLATSGHEKIRHIYLRAIKLCVLFGIPAFSVTFILATPLLQLWLQERFDLLLPPMCRILLVAAFLDLFGIPAHYTIIGIGYPSKILYSSMVRSGVNVVAVALIGMTAVHLPIYAVGWATMLGMCCSTSYLLWQAHAVGKTPEPITIYQ
jgi:O-antigen/teichoic acid export membrane protein